MPHPFGSSDHFRFSWNPLDGDFILQARVALTGLATAASHTIGWHLRSARKSETTLVKAVLRGDGRAFLQCQNRHGAPVAEHPLPLQGGDVLRLERQGQDLIFSMARTGEPLTSMTLRGVDLGDHVQAGLFLEEDSADLRTRASIEDVRVTRLPKQGYVPYTDYIGSRLEILNVFTGELKVVHSSEQAFEAPNWMADGRTLIYNVSGPGPGKGTLRTFDLITHEVAQLETGFAVKNNNDHVLSFDGTQLAISHHAEEDGGRSVIYTLPARGGMPVRVTPKSPSYLHGWSPDAHWLVYTGGRREQPEGADKYDIYKIRARGGEEHRLTDSPGLSDGPEYSPDGEFIYYNSTRSGLMQLWRMRADGSEQVQLTNDDCNNWFPHLSPDGEWLVFLSYGQDVQPDEHPYHRRVTLRLMPAAGGTPRIIAYLFGGQGTINVPSWAPDGTRIAFVSNTR